MLDNMETSKKLQHLSKIRKEMDYLQFELKLNSTDFLKIKKSFCDFHLAVMQHNVKSQELKINNRKVK